MGSELATCNFVARKNQFASFSCSNNSGACDIRWMRASGGKQITLVLVISDGCVHPEGKSFVRKVPFLSFIQKILAISLFLLLIRPLRTDLYPHEWSTRYSESLQDFLIAIPKGFKETSPNSFFNRTVRLWNILLAYLFSVMNSPNCFKSR